MDYKKYFQEIKIITDKYSEVVYYDPMSGNEILEIETQLGFAIKPLYRDYLVTFGLNQDIFKRLNTYTESILEDYNFIKNSLKGYLPIYSELDEQDTIFLINNSDLQDDNVYSVKISMDDKIGKIKKYKPFQKIIEKSISKLKKNHKKRCCNRDKINVTEFIIQENNFDRFLKVFELENVEQKTKWQPKYYPENTFGDEVAKFNIYDTEIIIERNEDKSEHRFDIEEPILTEITESILKKTETQLKKHNIKYNKIESKLIENK